MNREELTAIVIRNKPATLFAQRMYQALDIPLDSYKPDKRGKTKYKPQTHKDAKRLMHQRYGVRGL